jgi:hypothetical protein
LDELGVAIGLKKPEFRVNQVGVVAAVGGYGAADGVQRALEDLRAQNGACIQGGRLLEGFRENGQGTGQNAEEKGKAEVGHGDVDSVEGKLDFGKLG